jgi:quinol monooxygenase YgiN
MANNTKLVTVLAGVVLGLLGGVFLSSYILPDTRVNCPIVSDNKQGATIVHKNVFVLLVTLTFESESEKNKFKLMFGPMAQFVKANEPGTLSYELADDDKDPAQVIIIERYTDKSAYLDVHKTSKEFLEFRNQFAGFQNLKISGRSYIESNIGYV